MKRCLSSLLVIGIVGAALAQAPFTIVRPGDGSKVRENVRVLFPKNSVGDGQYVGIYLNDKFIEAVVPQMGEKYLYYDIDTKARYIPDGPLKIEAALFTDFAQNPVITARSSVNVSLGNSANIPMPKGGWVLRYKFKPGTQWVYDLENRIGVSQISEAQAMEGGRAATLPFDAENVRLKYSVDNFYGNGDGLIRIQAMTDKGKDWTVLSIEDKPEPNRYFDYQMAPIYMRVDNTGREMFGAIPRYFPLDGTTGPGGVQTDLFADFPLPTLPTKAVKPGDDWIAPILLSNLDLANKDTLKHLTLNQPARGELLGVEWEKGHPCAKIKHSFALGLNGSAPTGPDGKPLPADQIKTSAQSIDETIWFALDKGVVIKMVQNRTIDQKIEGGGGGGNAAPGTGGGAAPGSRGGGPRAAGAASGSGGGQTGKADIHTGGGSTPANFAGQNGPRTAGGSGAGSSRGGGGAPAPGMGGTQMGGTGANGRSGGSGETNTAQLVRINIQRIFTLEM